MIKFVKNYKTYLILGYVFLLLIHFGFKDHFYLTGIVFYTLPLPILILLLFILFVLCYKSKTIRYSSLVLLCVLNLLWFKNYYYNHNLSGLKNSHSVLLWNIANENNKNVNHLKDIIKNEAPETLLFVEVFYNPKDTTYFTKQLNSYNVKYLYGSMAVASKHKIEYVKYVKEYGNYKFSHIKLHSVNKPLQIIIIDVYAHPKHLRKDALKKILNYAETNDIDIIAGDFNTPYESVHFKNYAANYQSFRTYQNGLTATWPFGLPLLELDQIWIKKSFHPKGLKKHYSQDSDHAFLLGFYN